MTGESKDGQGDNSLVGDCCIQAQGNLFLLHCDLTLNAFLSIDLFLCNSLPLEMLNVPVNAYQNMFNQC